MIRKIAIIGVVLVVGGILLYPQLGKLGIKDNPTINAVAQDLGGLKDTTVKRVSYEIDKTTNTVGDKIEDIVPNPEQFNPIPKLEDQIAIPQKEEVYYGQVYDKNESENSCKVSVPKMAKTINGVKELTHTIMIQECMYEKNKPVQVTVSTDPITGVQTVSVDSMPQSKVFETLQLTTTKNADNTVSIHYEDSSGKTLKVTVTLHNSEKQLFTGEFFASKFDANVDDISDSPHIIEMIVEHADYGTVNSSVFNPQGNEESTIYGVFSQ
ncbi:MAG: hypothetical protein ACT4OD_05610 [Candidatus Nitrosotenuis sp.]